MGSKDKSVSRRRFLATSVGAAAGTIASPVFTSLSQERHASRKRLTVALVGTGIRGTSSWGKTLIEKYGDVLDMVGLCDINPKRLSYAKSFIQVECPTFTSFDRMMEETTPQAVIVATTDCYHAQYICRAMELGSDVISEKPLATDEEMCQEILDTEKKTGRNLIVTFNYRFGPAAVKIKELLMAKDIGDITSVDFNYYLDVFHGASYFRRWHGFKQYSGSLLVHKATHHFDLMNWWLDAEPVEVNAYGSLRKYGGNGAFRHTRCMTCPHKARCEFYWDITKDTHLMNLYVKAESEDGYLRDACVFRRNIDIWDTMNVQVMYTNRITMSYSLNAFMPYEGYSLGFNGTQGRLDVRVYHQQPWEVAGLADFRLTRNFKGTQTFNVAAESGGHWGADDKMMDMMFRNEGDRLLEQGAGSRDGALSILVGIAARRSIERKRPISIEELVRI